MTSVSSEPTQRTNLGETSRMTGSEQGNDAQRPGQVNPFFRLVIGAVVVFIVTILAILATIFGETNAPIQRFLSEFGGLLIGGEVAFILLVGLLALAVDRRRIVNDRLVRQQPSSEEEPAKPGSRRAELGTQNSERGVRSEGAGDKPGL